MKSARCERVVVVKAFDGRVLDRPLDLAVGQWVIWPRQTVLNPVGFADHLEAHLPRICCVPVAGLLGKLDAVVHCRARHHALMPREWGRIVWMLNGAPLSRCSRNSHAVLRPALSTSCVTANLLVRSMPTKRRSLLSLVCTSEMPPLLRVNMHCRATDMKNPMGLRLNCCRFGLSPSTSCKRDIPCRCRQRWSVDWVR